MERDNPASNGIDANSALKKHLTAAQRKRKKKRITIISVSALVVIAIVVTVLTLRKSVSDRYGSSESNVESAAVTVGSISTTVSGAGTLTDDDVEDVTIPPAVEIDKVVVEEGDTVNEGDRIATVNTASVVSAMADVQDQIDEIDAELASAGGDTVGSTIKAGISGRVKEIYAEQGDDVATVMYNDGALLLLSLDGLMAADIKTEADVASGDTVVVTLSDARTLEGTVESVQDGVATIAVTDDGTALGDAVTIADQDGNKLGAGTLYIHSEFRVTGYAGTISKVNVAENKKVSASTKLFSLTDTSYTANYDTLLKQRASLEEDLGGLIKLYKEGAVFSPISGVIYSVDYDEDGSDTSGNADAQADAADASAANADAAADSDSSDAVTVATVCPNATMSVTVDMDESDILSLKEGQEASVTIDSIGDDEFTGTVTEVNKTGASSNGVTVFTVEVTIDKTEQMLAGMSASVDIKIEGVENALLIPDDALQQTSSTSYVYTEYNEETGELGGMVEVTTGLSNGTSVEIKSGLEEGDTVYYDASDEEENQFMFGGMNQSVPGGPNTVVIQGEGFPSSQQGGQVPSGGQQSGGRMPSGGQ
ncbi:MAG: HlyD family efflux transporter periplasmic adaptor subunit [Bacillota bacterium]